MTKAEFKRRVQIITAICIVVFLAAIIILIGQLVSMITLKNKREALEAELIRKQKDYITAEQELKYRESADFAEQYAREILGLVKKGEQVYVIED